MLAFTGYVSRDIYDKEALEDYLPDDLQDKACLFTAAVKSQKPEVLIGGVVKRLASANLLTQQCV